MPNLRLRLAQELDLPELFGGGKISFNGSGAAPPSCRTPSSWNDTSLVASGLWPNLPPGLPTMIQRLSLFTPWWRIASAFRAGWAGVAWVRFIGPSIPG